jgi:hypothetical protein
MQTSNIIPLVKQAMLDHVDDNGPFLDDKDYEQWFVKYYMYYMDQGNLTATTAQNRKKNGLR